MTIVLDTNVWVSGLVWGGVPGQLLVELQRHRIQPVVTPDILLELADVLSRVKCQRVLARRNQSPADILRYIGRVSRLVSDRPSPISIPADPDDEVIIACAMTAGATVIVSGDRRHLLPLKSVDGIPILTPAQFLRRLRTTRR